jgi:hypothetical protein
LKLKLAFLTLVISLIGQPARAGNTADDANSMAERAKTTIEAFLQESLRLRLQYKLSGQFTDPCDLEKLRELAQKAGEQLEATAKEQNDLKRQIETYSGEDWEAKYGATGLWRKIFAELYITTLNKCEVDLYLAVASPSPQREETAKKIVGQIEVLDKTHRSVYSQLLRADALAILAQKNPALRSVAINQLDSIIGKSESNDAAYFKASVKKMETAGPSSPDQPAKLTREFLQSSLANDIELYLSLAFLQRQYDPNVFEKTVQSNPKVENFLGSLILSDLAAKLRQGQAILPKTSVFEAELAVHTAWQNKPQDYEPLLDNLSNLKEFQTPLILYVAAISSSETSPAKAVELLMKAGRLQQEQKSKKLDIEAEKIAKQAAKLAYNLFVQDSSNCLPAVEAFENYRMAAGQTADGEIDYLYSVVLSNCGQAEKGQKILQQLAEGTSNEWRSRAILDIILPQIRHQKKQATPFYESSLFRQLDKSAEYMLAAVELNRCEYAGEMTELLRQVVENIDLLESTEPNFTRTMEDCKRLAQFCYDCPDNQRHRQAGLLLAEVSAFADAKDQEKLASVDKLFNDIMQVGDANDLDAIRCRARLLAAQNKFGQAAQLWAKICETRKNDLPSANQRSWKWWQGKFYELDCWMKMPQTKKEDVLHTIEILESSFADIPPLWAEKLKSLKQKCY